MEKSEQEKFLDATGAEETKDIFEQPLTPTEEKPAEDKPEGEEETAEKARNRRERRLQAKLQAEREAGIQMATKLQLITEAQKARETDGTDSLKAIERIYGTDSPEAREATEILKQSLASIEERATNRALEVLREEQRKVQAEVQEAEQEIDTMLEEIEDEYDVDLSNKATRTAYLTLLEKMSPKDSNGNILQYADHHAVWEVYQARNPRTTENRAKDLASRTAVQSGSSQPSTIAQDVDARWLRENGII